MGDFKQLTVWQRAHERTLSVYEATAGLPAAERYGLTSQLRRAAASIVSNIAESRGRYTPRDQSRFLRMAQGSAREVECQLILARDLRLLDRIPSEQSLSLLDEVQRMLSALIRVTRTTA